MGRWGESGMGRTVELAGEFDLTRAEFVQDRRFNIYSGRGRDSV
jgi:formate dehydrogenase assembly factor FdhD